jgi:2-methylcitrate dehydratase PrpD
VEPGLSVKKYPCCYCTHPSIDGALALREQHAIRPADIVSIRAELSPFFLSPLIHHRPATGLEGKFSLEYALSAAMLDSRVVLATFTDAMVQRPEARRMIERVSSVAHDRSGDGLRATFVRLTVELSDGRKLTQEIAEPRGAASNPLSDSEIEDKFRDCCQFAGAGSDMANQALAMLWKVDKLKRVGKLASSLTVAVGGSSESSRHAQVAGAEEGRTAK